MSSIDWIKIKNEYINTNISQRKLAEKHGISFNTLKVRANKEKWADVKKEQHNKIAIKTQQKTVDKIVRKESDRISRINSAADRLLDKIEEATEQLNNHLVKNKKRTKVIEYKNTERPDKPTKEIIEDLEEADFITGDIDRLGLKMVASALRELKDITKDERNAEADKQININLNWDRGKSYEH